MSGLESVPSAYLSIGFLAVVGIIMPLTNFLITWVVRPKVDPARPHVTRSYLLEGYERDHSLYPRRLTTFECGSEPVGEAMIQFHFQYYWYAIIFLVFDVAFMFLVLGGMVASDATAADVMDRETAVAGAKKALATLAIKCCAIEMAAAATPRFDGDRFGVLFRSSPRQSDVLLVNGPISKKFADKIVRLWEQMPEPKYCIAMGECAISGGPYFQSYNILEGVDTVIPVDVYIPGCPPRPEALIDGFGLLREKIIRIGAAPSSGRKGDKPIIVGED